VGWTVPQNSAARYHRGWTGAGRSDIIRHLVITIDPFENLSSLAYGAAVSVAEIMAASSAHISLIVGDEFCDLVNVGELEAHEVTFPVDQYYPLAALPAATERLLSHRGYLSTDTLEVVTEYIASLPGEVPACFMGVPIIAQGQVFGELFLCRGEGQPKYTPEDLELAMDLATVLGSRIPGVLAMEEEAVGER